MIAPAPPLDLAQRFAGGFLALCELAADLDLARPSAEALEQLRARYDAARGAIGDPPPDVDAEELGEARALSFEVGMRLDRLQGRERLYRVEDVPAQVGELGELLAALGALGEKAGRLLRRPALAASR